MTEALVTAPHVHACATGRDIVFLDVRRDRYFAVRASSRASAWLQIGCDTFGIDAGAAQALAARGLAYAAASAPVRASQPLRLSRVKPVQSNRLRAAVAAAFDAVRCVRPRGLARGIARLGRWKAGRAGGASMDVAIESAWFRDWRLWWPVQRKCLFDSVALAGFLLRRGAAADVVFGVRTGPFAAHCWVESDGVILLDAPEYCASFTPILRV